MNLHSAFMDQAAACQTLGSAFTARVLRLCAAHLTDKGPVGVKLHSWPGDITHRGESVPLRLMGALHAVVLTDRNAALSAVYPPRDQSVDDRVLWAAIDDALTANSEFILDWITSPPQTNEPARSGALMPGFMSIAAHYGMPLVLSEIGASAGLNQWWDQYSLQIDQQVFGAKGSPLTLAPDWMGPKPPLVLPQVRSRAGCDLNPIDIHDPQGRLRLMSYIWPDQADRLERMQAALDIAKEHRKTVVKADAIDWLQLQLAKEQDGAVRVIYNSIAWQYLPPQARNKGAAMISAAGQKATASAPLAWLQMEADDTPGSAALTLHLWPGNRHMTLGRADFHGRWVQWQGMEIPSDT